MNGFSFSYDNLSKRGIRIALRGKVNDSLVIGLRIVDSILPVGRGQRQLISIKVSCLCFLVCCVLIKYPRYA